MSAPSNGPYSMQDVPGPTPSSGTVTLLFTDIEGSTRLWEQDAPRMSQALADAGVKTLSGRFLDFLDPWGNRIEIVGYDNIQFSKTPNVLRGMGLAHLSKNDSAIEELKKKGMAPN